jgi:hypothetical protein
VSKNEFQDRVVLSRREFLYDDPDKVDLVSSGVTVVEDGEGNHNLYGCLQISAGGHTSYIHFDAYSGDIAEHIQALSRLKAVIGETIAALLKEQVASPSEG